MPRPVLEESRLHSAIRPKIDAYHPELIAEVQQAAARHPVLVVGMAWNPFVGRARRYLDAAGIAHHDIDYGSYVSQWRLRLALKMWTGWSTFPMVFVRGMLVGGAEDLKRLIDSGELKPMLA